MGLLLGSGGAGFLGLGREWGSSQGVGKALP